MIANEFDANSCGEVSRTIFSFFCLFQNAILYEMLNLALEALSSLSFSECTYYWLQHFFSSYGYLFEMIFAS